MLIMARTPRNQAPLAFGQASNPTKSLRLSPSTAPGIRRLEYCSPLSPQKAGRTEWEMVTARMNPTHTHSHTCAEQLAGKKKKKWQ